MACNVTDASAIPAMEDLFLYHRPQPGDLPPPEAGAAMLALIKAEQFPGFAMSHYPDLEAAGRDQPAPARLALIADDAILLAPSPTATGWRGFLVAEDTAAGQVRAFHWPGDPEPLWLAVPTDESGSATWAAAGSSLTTAQSPDTPD